MISTCHFIALYIKKNSLSQEWKGKYSLISIKHTQVMVNLQITVSPDDYKQVGAITENSTHPEFQTVLLPQDRP